jgi:flagellar basal-body rod modification protein FlgD
MDEIPWAVAAAGLLTAVPRASETHSSPQEPSSLKIDRDAFLRLLLAQIRNQDPLSPIQGEEFLSQLAQLTTLEQMWKMNESLQTFMTQEQLLQASALIGRTVQAMDEAGRFVEGIVQGVRVRSGVITLDLGDHEILLSQITSVR